MKSGGGMVVGGGGLVSIPPHFLPFSKFTAGTGHKSWRDPGTRVDCFSVPNMKGF